MPGGSLYHASKWVIEGFIEALSQEVAPFKIECTLVEPGGARTNFRSTGAQLSTPMDAYKGTPAAFVHSFLKDTSRLAPGDPAKMVEIMIASADLFPAPKRIVLGSDSYGIIGKALTERLESVVGQKGSAALTNFPT